MLRILVPTVALVFGAALAQPAAAQSGVDRHPPTNRPVVAGRWPVPPGSLAL